MASLNSWGLLRKSAPSYSLMGQAAPEADPYGLNNLPADPTAIDAAAPADTSGIPAAGSDAATAFVNGAAGQKGMKRSIVGENKQDRKSQLLKSLIWSPEESKQIQDQVMGITRGTKLDENGQPMYSKVPKMDPSSGLPMLDTAGQVVLENGEPIPDPSKDIVDPENPIQQEKAGIEQLRSLLGTQMKNTPARRSLSSLAALADYLAPGGKSQEAYANFDKSHPSYGELAPKIMGYQDEIQKRKADISKQLLEGMKSMKAGTQLDLLSSMMLGKQSQEQANPQPKNPGMAAEHWLKGLQGDKELQKVDGGANGLEDASHMLASKNSVGDSNFKVRLLKALEAGRITTYELQMESGDKGLMNRFDQVVQNVKDGTLTDKSRREYAQLIGQLSQSLRDKRDRILQYHQEIGHNVYGPAGVDSGMVDDAVNSYRNRTAQLTSVTKSPEQKAAAASAPKAKAKPKAAPAKDTSMDIDAFFGGKSK